MVVLWFSLKHSSWGLHPDTESILSKFSSKVWITFIYAQLQVKLIRAIQNSIITTNVLLKSCVKDNDLLAVQASFLCTQGFVFLGVSQRKTLSKLPAADAL